MPADRLAAIHEREPRDRRARRKRRLPFQVKHGVSNADIADELVVREATVKTHMARVRAKLGACDRVQAVVRAF